MSDIVTDVVGFEKQATELFGSESILLPTNKPINVADIAIDQAKRIYKMITKLECPDAFLVTSGFPEHLKVLWSKEGHLGEFDLSTPARSDKRFVDESQWDEVYFGNKLANYRVIDEVNANAGPFFVLYQIKDGVVEDDLYFFDTKDCWKMDIGFEAYIKTALSCFAPIFWQCLFIDEPLVPNRAETLQNSLDWLLTAAPSTELQMLKSRIDAKMA